MKRISFKSCETEIVSHLLYHTPLALSNSHKTWNMRRLLNECSFCMMKTFHITTCVSQTISILLNYPQLYGLSEDPWWRHKMETFSALLALCEGDSPVTGELPSQRPVTRRFDIVFDLRLNKRLNKHSRRRWFESPSRLLWRHSNAICNLLVCMIVHYGFDNSSSVSLVY